MASPAPTAPATPSQLHRPPGAHCVLSHFWESVPCLAQKMAPNPAKKIPSLIVFGRIRGSNVNQATIFLIKDAEAAKKAGSDAGLSSLEVQTEEHRKAAATLPEGAINTQGRFSLSPASPEITAELERLLKAETAKVLLRPAVQNQRPHRQRFPPISGGNSSQGRRFLQRALTRTMIWRAGGKRSSAGSTMVNSSSVGRVTPTSPEPAAARNILPSFTRKSLPFDSSGYERNNGRCCRMNHVSADRKSSREPVG
jgi:hypothetical protein